jgi:uncharacterized membrane protein YedE/YeeE
MRNVLCCSLAGVLFGVGLTIGGMTDPYKVIGFLDLFGQWDPSLAFVMGGALLVTIPMFVLTKNLRQSWAGFELKLPSATDIDRPLVLGAVLFGIGWGLYGLCPGPAIANIWTLNTDFLIFVGSMVVGLLIARQTSKKP